MFLAVAAYAGIGAWIAWIEFGFSGDGVASVVGGAIGTFAILGLIAAVVSVRSKTKTAYVVALAVSAAMLVHSHWSGVLDGYDGRAYKGEMAQATPDNYTEILKASKTRIGQSISAMLVATQTNRKELGALFQDIDDKQFADMLATETLQSPEKIARLGELAKVKQQIALTADTKIDAIFETMYRDIATSARELSSRQQATLLAEYKTSSETLKSVLKRNAHADAEVYGGLIGMYAILQQNAGHYDVTGPASVVFYNTDAVAPFNIHFTNFVNASKEIADIQKTLAALQSNGVNQIIQSTHD